ncbi:MAG: NAD+ synthase [Candidatus Aminicenantes bacterium]|nr:NAD+ synthase [Candidatus Aminicenantes bacterium]
MTINAPFAVKILTAFIRDELAKFGFAKGVLGLSGGLDSSVCAALAVRALGPSNVLGLMMPYSASFTADLDDAGLLAKHLGIAAETIDIRPMVDAYFERRPTDDRVRRGNKMARERMSILYDVSARDHSLILGTSNKTELLIGYGTIHGDMACAINPMGDLYKTQVRQLAAHLEIPEQIQAKKPTAGLWAGQTDEDELGLTYAEIDEILFKLVDERERREDLLAAGAAAKKVDRVLALIKGSEFKRQLPPIAKISARTIGHDFLYPYDWER